MKRKMRVLITITMLMLALAACGSKIPDPLNWKLDNFSYTNQENEPFGLSDLKGKVWIADFIFTNCETVCPPMTANMAKLQKKMKEEGLDVEFVSFSVDPEHDTPEALKEYAAKFDGDLTNWHFLTGYKQEEIEQFALKQFKTIAQMPKESNQVIHGTDFYLVDQEGKVVKSYSGVSNTPYDEIIEHVKALQ
ncbi:SCO family protein [Bacillus songklensis]|uniref:SCO family protein n=1 Tax=Bacillus songklensis TaxID=1069116 RepID=A0ABV8B6R5_9BACI